MALYGGAQGLSIKDALSSTSGGATVAAQAITFFDINSKDPVPVQFRNIVPTPQAIRPTRFAHSTARIGSKLYVYGGFGVDVRIDPESVPVADLIWDDRLIELSLGCDSGQGYDPFSQDCAPCVPGYFQSSSYGFSVSMFPVGLSRTFCKSLPVSRSPNMPAMCGRRVSTRLWTISLFTLPSGILRRRRRRRGLLSVSKWIFYRYARI